MIHNVYMYGWLADKYGSEVREIDADKLLVIINGLAVDDPNIKKDITSSEIHFVLNNDEDDWFALDNDTIGISLDNYKNIHLIPSIEGGAPALIPIFLAIGASAATAAALASLTVSILVSVAIAGISALLSPSPKMNKPASDAQEAATKQSFLFNGATNATEQGGIAQIVFGVMRVGSTVISVGVTTEDY